MPDNDHHSFRRRNTKRRRGDAGLPFFVGEALIVPDIAGVLGLQIGAARKALHLQIGDGIASTLCASPCSPLLGSYGDRSIQHLGEGLHRHRDVGVVEQTRQHRQITADCGQSGVAGGGISRIDSPASMRAVNREIAIAKGASI